MIVDLFKIPIFIGNIDVNKINLKNQNFYKTWVSQTNSSYKESFENVSKMSKESIKYLMETIVKILQEKINYPFELKLYNIWENHYINNDYQEPHIHSNSDFSFIIYKDVKQGKTVFLNPIRNYLLFYKNISHMFEENIMPKCKTGHIVIFPRFLEHMVLKSSKQKTISGNLGFKKQ